ncbi:MAG: hypothetical protein OXF84_10580 [Bacteroidetes bacterium]|nr:hypothetical protein [Bacteroidota bacterium]
MTRLGPCLEVLVKEPGDSKSNDENREWYSNPPKKTHRFRLGLSEKKGRKKSWYHGGGTLRGCQFRMQDTRNIDLRKNPLKVWGIVRDV